MTNTFLQHDTDILLSPSMDFQDISPLHAHMAMDHFTVGERVIVAQVTFLDTS